MAVSREWKYFYSAGDDHEFLFDRINGPRESSNKAGLAILREPQERLKQSLLNYLKKEGAVEAYTETGSALDWKRYPRNDDSYLLNPDSGLLLQDHDAHILDRPGYTR